MDLLRFLNRKPQPRDIARDRLKLVLIQDRFTCSPQLLEMLKTDILRVITNYMEIDEEELDIQISEGNLFANIPIKNVRKAPQR